MHASCPDAVRLAAVGIGAVRVGIPLDSVVQAIPVPEVPATLPRRHGALRGVVLHDGALIPVVDLARWVDAGAARPDGQAGERIMILRAAGRTIGLQVDTIDGMVDVARDAIARLHHDDSPDEVFHSAAHVIESGRILSLLDVGRLADLAASWHQADAPSPAQTVPGTAQAAVQGPAGECYALLQLDAVRLGLSAADLAEVIAMPALTRVGGGIDGAYCLWRGRHLPVLAGGALPGLPDASAAPLLAVVEHAGLALGLPAHKALALQCLPGGFDALTATVYDDDGAEVCVVGTAALFARYPEASMSRDDTVAGGVAAPPAARDAGMTNDCAYVVFDAGKLCATPIAAVEHILPLPAAAGATLPWQGAAIRLVDLRPPAPQAGAALPGHVLVVSAGAEPVGYVVTRVELLVPAGSGKRYRLGSDPQRAVEFVTVDAAGGQASYRIVDLARTAAFNG
jgi:chemotaxis signal transduction protein